MLTLDSKSMDKTASEITRLCVLVEQDLASIREMNIAPRRLDSRYLMSARPVESTVEHEASTTSTKTVNSLSDNATINIQPNQTCFTFDEELLASRVYRKSGTSHATSSTWTTASSLLSCPIRIEDSNISL